MKDQSPIKRHEALVAFSRDHHFGLLLVWKIRQGFANRIDPVRISDYLLYCFTEDLQHHFREEEQRMFAKLPVDDILRQQAEGEHQAIYQLVKKIGDDKSDEMLLRQFSDTLQDHIRFEERVLFAYIQEKFDAADLNVISTYHGVQSEDIDAQWNDPFWTKKIVQAE